MSNNAVGSLAQSTMDIFTSILNAIGNVFNTLFSLGSSIVGDTAVLSKDVVNLIFGASGQAYLIVMQKIANADIFI